MIDRARVLVIGGGIAGVSTLYHLTRLGWDDVALVEANELTSGSTWHAAGLCTQFIQSYNLMTLLRRSLELYDGLPEETGVDVGLHRCGSVRIATTDDRLHQFEHVLGIAENVGVPMEIVSPERGRGALPARDVRRRPRGRPPAHRRPRRPLGRHHEPRPRGARPRGDDRAPHARDRRCTATAVAGG